MKFQDRYEELDCCISLKYSSLIVLHLPNIADTAEEALNKF